MVFYRRIKRQQIVTIIFVILFVYIYKVNYDNNSPNIIDTKANEHYPQGSFDDVTYIRRDCGELCETVAIGEPGPFFDQISVPINCEALFKNEHIDRGHGLSIPPKTIPKHLHMDFTMNNKLNVSSWYFNEAYLSKTAKMAVWTENVIQDYISLAKDNKLEGTYGVSETNALRDGLKHAHGIINGRVLIIGSEIPWVEACALEAGAREVVTLEYGKIVSKHPQIKTMIPDEFRKSYLNKTLGSFDAIVTFSSIEHSGLGRYGDGLNPWGDIIAVARGWCVTKEGGSLTIGVPYSIEKDYIKFNAGRWYGKIRYPYLTTNWKQHYQGHGRHRVHVFTKSNVNFTKTVKNYLKEPHQYFLVNNTDTHYSQAHQDETVYTIFPREQGFFVEMGAYNGQLFSNTLWLERKHRWTGLLIEANPDLCREIDALKRHAWRLCACISDTFRQTDFFQGGAVGGMAPGMDSDHLKMIRNKRTISVPCFNMVQVTGQIGVHHINYFSLDVEGSEMVILESIRIELITGKIVVDIWSIEYRVYDGKKNIVNKSFANLQNIRHFFENVGGYVEHSQLNNEKDDRDGMALDVVFVHTKSWCKMYKTFPNGTMCSV
ncbi:uncharacterized protein LOC127737452 [Mytilus californianus]|uniref:uncharacterized protein LOC127737452 n=1 Tax=Mytilus californianus TaxID=6549 RepID=UPI0022481909|nr:uncharacterized protein LOC127737452 [Mytilus californianus]XP_052104117.1 uncharacterized protein LOC127737452 [Mytilus californianus]